ncbi:MAG TPA: DNA repair protein RecO [Verrucomicrobia bacterium]|nr:DNA repair protein RecO [Verrucomicrobiota bacterium]HOB32299.1 DNA repair protein RecO [Verrucomicrobiota bacterium]HOP96124.1 DNA repair protein RecO [Verrucomicrobiota bacterium]HPU57596.1 DNA repair protein RecO [Verrucomicrobiota bacterium]
MIERAQGVILRTRPLTDTSLIVHWLTQEQGRISTVAKGARRPKSPFRGKLDLFYEAEFSFNRSRRSDLHTLHEVSLRETHESLRRDLAGLRQASYCAALIEQTTETETPIPEILQLFLEFLESLPASGVLARNIFAFEIKLLRLLGLEPSPEKSRLAKTTADLVAALADSTWPEIANLKPAPADVRNLRAFLHGFLIFHLGRIPRGRAEALRPAQ